MSTEHSHRVSRPLTTEELERLQRNRERVAQELPDLAARDQMRKEAQEEPTLSGDIRRAIHASQRSLATIASEAGISGALLDEFLTGERTLRSDVLDRITNALGFRFHPAT